MEDASNILVASTAIIGLVSIACASFKDGFIFFSAHSFLRKDQTKYEIDDSKVGKFTGIILTILFINTMYGLAVVRDTREIGAVLIFSLLNTAFIAYALAYWALLKKK